LAGAVATKQRYRQPGYALWNATITWTDPTDHYWVSLFGRNLTDKTYFNNLRGFASGDEGDYAPPRIIGGRIGYRF
jgi:iron complex outermembrane receptor protein